MKLTKYQLKVLLLWLRYHEFGYGFEQWIRVNWRAWLILGLLLPVSIFLIVAGAPAFGWAYLGYFLGVFLRDITYFRLGRRNWSLMLDVVNWNRVQQLVDANEKPVTTK